MLKYLSSFILMSTTLNLTAQTVDVSECTVITDGEERLNCYDDLAGLTTEESASAPITGAGKWSVSQTKDPLTDAERVILNLAPESGASSFRPRALIVRCNDDETDVFISWGDYIADNTQVTIRIGELSPVTRTWSISTNNQATFYPGDAVTLAKQMLDHNQFVARTQPYNESPVTLIFDTTGMSEAIAPLREACGW